MNSQHFDDDEPVGLDWSKPLEWSTGERLVDIDGPSFDGGFEVRAPIEFAIKERETSCTVDMETGIIAHPNRAEYPHLRYMENCFYAENTGEIFSCVKNPTGTGGYVVSKIYPQPKFVAVVDSPDVAERAALLWLKNAS